MYSWMCNSDHQMPVIMKEGFADSKGNGMWVRVSYVNAEPVSYTQHLYGFFSSWKWEKLSKFTLLRTLNKCFSFLASSPACTVICHISLCHFDWYKIKISKVVLICISTISLMVKDLNFEVFFGYLCYIFCKFSA